MVKKDVCRVASTPQLSRSSFNGIVIILHTKLLRLASLILIAITYHI